MTPPSSPEITLLRRRADNGKIVEVKESSLRFWIPVGRTTVAYGMTRPYCLKGDVEYIRCSSDSPWVTRVYPIPAAVLQHAVEEGVAR